MVAGVAAELLWTVRRPLPSLVGLDASGILPGRAPGEPVRLVVLGDSASTGPGLERAEHVWFRQALAKLDLDRPVEITSLAVGGSRVTDVRGRVDEAIQLGADLAIVAVGSNDAIHGTQVRRFAEQLDGVLRRLMQVIPVVAVCNVGDLGNVARVPPPLTAGLRARSRSICRAIEQVVAQHDGAVLLDMTTSNEAFRERSVFAPDLFHPSEAGHAAWADAALPGLRIAFDRLRTDAAYGVVEEPAWDGSPEPSAH